MTKTVGDMYPTLVANGPSDLIYRTHTAAAAASVSIAHAQLRHLISCPIQRGIVYYVGGKSILECDLLNAASHPKSIVDIEFSPTCFTATAVGSNPTMILFAAGGYNSDLYLSLHAFSHGPQTSSIPSNRASSSLKLIWRHYHRLRGRHEIVNSILFTPATLTDDARRSPSDIRIAVGGNDAAVKLFEVGMLPTLREDQRLQECGSIKLETPVNHMSFSPDGRTLLCAGDTPKAYLFNISPGSTANFSPLAVYTLPRLPPTLARTSTSPTNTPANFGSQACFSTAWSADGLKFAVASQEGQLCVWDVRSAHPLLNFWTPFRRNSLLVAAGGRGRLGEWEWEDLGGQMRPPTDDATNNGPDSGIRNVRFSAGEGGRELLVFTEHTLNLHIIDARTLDLASHSVVRFPDLSFPPSSSTPSLTSAEPRTPSPVSSIPSSIPERPSSPIVIQRSRSRSRTHSTTAGRSRSRSDPPASPHTAEDRNETSRSGTPPDEAESRHMRSRSPQRGGSTTLIPAPPPRSQFGTHTIIMPIRSRSRSRTPPVIPRDLSWSPTPDSPESRAWLDLNGDTLEGNGAATEGIRAPTRRPGHDEVIHPLREGSTQFGAAVEEAASPEPRKPVHLAGLCFDPSGGWVYVASESCIVEWRVRERAEGKTYWGSGVWA